MLIRINVEKVIKKMGVTGVDITHSSVSDANEHSADLFVIGNDLENFASSLPRKILLENIMDIDELETKLKEWF